MEKEIDFSLFELVSALVVVVDRSGCVAWWNRACTALTGHALEEIRGRTLWDELLTPESAPPVREAFERLETDELPGHFELSWIARDGGRRWIAWSSSAIRGEDGKIRYVVGTGVDITERKQAEDERTHQLDWLEAAIETAPVGMMLFTSSGGLSFNRRAEVLLGIDRSKGGERPRYLEVLYHPDGTPYRREELIVPRVLERGEVISREEAGVFHPDGRKLFLVASAAPIRDGAGRILGGVAIFEDITGYRAMEESLRASEDLLWNVIDLLPVGVFITDVRGQVTAGNLAGERIWGGAREFGIPEYGQYKGWWADTGKPITPGEWAVVRALEKGETTIGEMINIQCLDGTRKTILSSAVPLRNESGQISGAIIVDEDITSLRQTEAALRRALQDREEILAIVSHDLRSPLSAIRLSADSLQWAVPLGTASRGLQEATRAIVSSIQRMERLIEDLCDRARIEGGQFALKRNSQPVAPLVAAALDVLRPIAQSVSVQLKAEVPEGLEVHADRDRVLQVLINLLGNAVKFTPKGGVITVSAESTGSEVRLSVRDTGPGIPPEHQQFLFERFWQADRADRRGLGLGLFICKSIVESHGGRIWGDSRMGEGSTFSFTLPVAQAA